MLNTRRSLLLGAALLASFNFCTAAEPASPALAEQEVRDAVMAFNRTYEENDLETYFAFYLDDATMFFNSDFLAIADYKADWHKMIESGGAVEKNTVTDLKVKVSPSGEAAVATYRLEVHTRQPDGQITRDLSQESDSWLKVDGSWRIAHLHYASQPQP